MADHALHELGQLADGQVLPAAHVEQAVGHARGGDALEREDDGLADVVDVEELAPRGAAAPERDGPVGPAFAGRAGLARLASVRLSPALRQTELGLVEAADQRRQHVRRGEVEVVAGAVQVRRHEREVVGAVLAVEAAAHLDAGDLGDRVRAVRLLQRAGEEVLLLERLRRLARVDAGAAEEDEAAHAVREGRLEEVRLDHEVVVDELPGLLPVGHDAADLGGGVDDHVGAVRVEERPHRRLVAQVDLAEVGDEGLGVAVARQGAPDRRAHEPGVAGEVDALAHGASLRHATTGWLGRRQCAGQ